MRKVFFTENQIKRIINENYDNPSEEKPQMVDDESATVEDNGNGGSTITVGAGMLDKGKNAVKDTIKQAANKFGCNLNKSTVCVDSDEDGDNNEDGKIPMTVTSNDLMKGSGYIDTLKKKMSSNTGVSVDKISTAINAMSMLVSENGNVSCRVFKKGKIDEALKRIIKEK